LTIDEQMKKIYLTYAFLFWLLMPMAKAQKSISLSSSKLKVEWVQEADGWHINSIKTDGKTLNKPSGAHTIIYLNRKPAPNLVDLDIEGKDFTYYPKSATQLSDGSISFKETLRFATVESIWKIDPKFPTDIKVKIIVSAIAKGSYAIATPTLAVIDPTDLSWGMIPGNWYGRSIQTDFQLATLYSMGLPAVPYLAKEKNTMTLSPMITTRDMITLAVIPDPGTAADPWESNAASRGVNKVGMSTMNRHNELTPVAYSPVLGQSGSYVQEGAKIEFNFRYSIQNTDWFPTFSHAVEDVYQFSGILATQKQVRSLSERVRLMQVYLRDKKQSNWNTWHSKGFEIGANGTKNADIGAMWMIANAGIDTVLQRRLPFVRNYKLAQQQTEPGFFQGAGMGEYADEDGVESERGNYVEPLFTTYYTLMDMGNMLLFKPNDEELKARVRLAADKLIAWQHADGGYDVAYDRFSEKVTFPDLKDLRPTWYGLFIAYKVLGDEKYLKAAEKGAQYLIENGVDKGHYLGVCGDARNIWDFATAQCSESLLELYHLTHKETYKKAAIDAAQIYATSIFTQPIATTKEKTVAGVKRQDWEISQVGLSVEHIRGTASSGPILISSFAGLFTRIFELTNDSLFLHMARAAARGRDAFVSPDNGQSIYYYNGMENVNRAAKIFPHHAYWQIGWITDYLISETHLRSKGQISFPSGFMTPKVGPHVAYGFAPGKIFNAEANLFMPAGLLKSQNPYLEYIAAVSDKKDKLYVMVLNQSLESQKGSINIDLDLVSPGKKWIAEKLLQGNKPSVNRDGKMFQVNIPAWGMNVIEISLK
jgi:hypothetical protein